jgi:hypothetical protein
MGNIIDQLCWVGDLVSYLPNSTRGRVSFVACELAAVSRCYYDYLHKSM